MELDSRKVQNSLKSKGFRTNKKGDHIRFCYIYQGSRTKYKTKISHGHKSIGDNLISLMARQLELSKDQFIGVVECPVSKENLLNIYLEKGF